MRYTPVAVALSLLAATSSSVLLSQPPEQLDPRASMLLSEGRAAAAAGNIDGAIDAYESALTVEPGSVTVLLSLADATRRQGMQGKALHYYRVALTSDPRNVTALAGEGMALAEKGATEKANRNLAAPDAVRQGLCGSAVAGGRDRQGADAAHGDRRCGDAQDGGFGKLKRGAICAGASTGSA